MSLRTFLKRNWLGAVLAIAMTYPIVSLAKDEAVAYRGRIQNSEDRIQNPDTLSAGL